MHYDQSLNVLAVIVTVITNLIRLNPMCPGTDAREEACDHEGMA